MKICFLNENLDIKAGVGRFGRDVVENISKKEGIEAIVLTEQESGHKLERAVLRKSYLMRHFHNIFVNAFKIRKYIKKCDIVHALDGYPYGVIAALANIGLNKKLIINGIGTYSILPLDIPLKKGLMSWAYKRADRIICISRFTEKQILKRVKLDNTIVINHGVNYDKFNRSRLTRIKTQKDADAKVILSVGALKLRKGYHISIPAIAEVKKKYKNIKYWIVGGHPSEFYSDLIKKYKLEMNVKFFQNISDEDLIELYYWADIFLLTPITINNNDFEGFGLVYLEAGACGKPVIGTYDCGAEDAIINNVTGLLVPQRDTQKTAEAVLKLLNNDALLRRLGEGGKKRAQEMRWDNVVEKYLEIYKQVLW
ncbi:MAG: glycosyltransferase family 4 protein [Patescibacteria group bacterium]